MTRHDMNRPRSGAWRRGFGALLLAAALARPARAEAPRPDRPVAHHELTFHRSIDRPVTALTLGAAIGVELTIDRLAPDDCRWCDRDADTRDRLNGFDASMRRRLRWARTDRARAWSNLAAAGAVGWSLAPSLAWGDRRQFSTDAGLIAEAAGVTGVLTQVTKLVVGRQRPRAHFRFDSAASPTAHERHPDDNLSFFSGHAAGAFAVAVAAGRIADLRGRPHRGWTWGIGLSLAALTGYLRVAADEHYASDVLAGAAVGSAVGWFVPGWHHAPAEVGWRLAPGGGPTVGKIVRLELQW